jgi:hypothetical protein
MSEDQAEFKLTASERVAVQKTIDNAVPGTYTLRQLFGKKRWEEIGKGSERQEYGERFMASFLLRELENVELHPEKTSANARQYIVRKS